MAVLGEIPKCSKGTFRVIANMLRGKLCGDILVIVAKNQYAMTDEHAGVANPLATY